VRYKQHGCDLYGVKEVAWVRTCGLLDSVRPSGVEHDPSHILSLSYDFLPCHAPFAVLHDDVVTML
jgi:hypothetical protein